jgi:hypothetical protein
MVMGSVAFAPNPKINGADEMRGGVEKRAVGTMSKREKTARVVWRQKTAKMMKPIKCDHILTIRDP